MGRVVRDWVGEGRVGVVRGGLVVEEEVGVEVGQDLEAVGAEVEGGWVAMGEVGGLAVGGSEKVGVGAVGREGWEGVGEGAEGAVLAVEAGEGQ